MKTRIIHIEDALIQRDNFQWVDVRSESEFAKGHIKNSINIPLLSDEHRVLIGTCYKQKGREKAVSLGYELVGPKMKSLYEEYTKILKLGKPLLFYCWRGGLRSQISSQLFQWGGFEPILLKGGYKSYRNWAQSIFQKPYSLLILGGKTGSGKTEILGILEDNNIQTIDLEGLASHRGSAFGSLGMPPQPNTEQFENALAELLNKKDPSKKIILENESRLIGKCFIPQGIWNLITEAPIIELEIPYVERFERILKEYGNFPKEELIEKTEAIRKRLGGQHANEAIEMLQNGNKNGWLEKVMFYYDKAYSYSADQNINRSEIIHGSWQNIQELINVIKDKV